MKYKGYEVSLWQWQFHHLALCLSAPHPPRTPFLLFSLILTCTTSFFQKTSWTLPLCCPAACQQVRERETWRRKEHCLHACYYVFDFFKACFAVLYDVRLCIFLHFKILASDKMWFAVKCACMCPSWSLKRIYFVVAWFDCVMLTVTIIYCFE